MLRIAIIGCGKIADQHLLAIRRISECRVVACCDQELLMAKQLAERFEIAQTFSDAEEMLGRSEIDVVHITTPPQNHFASAKLCLNENCHVYVEKPFTVTAAEAETLVQLAKEHGLKITAGHNYQFTPEMLRMRQLVGDGLLGGAPVHIESYWPYDLSDTTYAAALLGNRTHWVRQLPGQLLHNVISHGIAKLAEFLQDVVELVAWAHQSTSLRGLGESDVMDELRVLLRDSHGTTGFFCFSSQIKPPLNQLRIYGPNNSLVVDHGSGSLLRFKNRAFKSYLTYFVPPMINGLENWRNARTNITNFLRRRLYQDFGMKELIERFYQSLRCGSEPPIPYREILLTSKIMDETFAQIYKTVPQPSHEGVVGPRIAGSAQASVIPALHK